MDKCPCGYLLSLQAVARYLTRPAGFPELEVVDGRGPPEPPQRVDQHALLPGAQGGRGWTEGEDLVDLPPTPSTFPVEGE